MGGTEAAAFNGNAEKFADYAETVRGYVRYEVVHRNLAELVASGPLDVVDIGGGAGIDTLWLAELGHTVTLIEPAQDQLELAHERIAQAPEAVQARITWIKDGIDTVPNLAGRFDLALSHGVAMYMPSPQAYIKKLTSLLKPGGRLSVLEGNYFGKEAELVVDQKWSDLKPFQQTQRTTNNVDREAHYFKPPELRDVLQRNGINLQAWRGVRVISDNMHQPITDFTPAELRAIVDVEYSQGREEHIRWHAQMLHFIGQKVPTQN
jgi:SAM-dependent methyltransferase